VPRLRRRARLPLDPAALEEARHDTARLADEYAVAAADTLPPPLGPPRSPYASAATAEWDTAPEAPA